MCMTWPGNTLFSLVNTPNTLFSLASVISVWGWQLTYTALVPFIMFVEIFSAVKTSIVRY